MNHRQNITLRTWLPVLLWMLFIFILSSVPGRDIPDLPVPFFHSVVHFIEYSILGALWIKAFTRGCGAGLKFFKFSIVAWTLTAIFALSDEWHQTFTPGRSGKLEDAYLDAVSAAIGIVLFLVYLRITGDSHLKGDRHSGIVCPLTGDSHLKGDRD